MVADMQLLRYVFDTAGNAFSMPHAAVIFTDLGELMHLSPPITYLKHYYNKDLRNNIAQRCKLLPVVRRLSPRIYIYQE